MHTCVFIISYLCVFLWFFFWVFTCYVFISVRKNGLNVFFVFKDMEEAKRKHDEEMAKKAADKLRREQEEDRKYKERLMEKLKQDKLNRDAAKVRARVCSGVCACVCSCVMYVCMCEGR